MDSMSKFIQLIEVNGHLHALDDEGGVWKYIPSGEKDQKKYFSFWTQLTTHRKRKLSAEASRGASRNSV